VLNLVASAALAAGLLGCSASPLGATDANLAKAKSQASQGANVFDRSCSSCHGPRGEGLAGAPMVIGAGALTRYPRDGQTIQVLQDPAQIQRQQQQRLPGEPSRAEFVSAKDLHDYLAKHMTDVGSTVPKLSDADYWDVVGFVLVAHGSDVPAGGVSSANAGNVLIQPR
jgi:mono/diheme cytochrome c family protein